MRYTFALIFTIVSTFCYAQQIESNVTMDAPVFKFETKTINYGKILKDSDGIRTFEFMNIGNSPLVITKVSSSCGCMIPKMPEDPIMPGGKGEIQVEYDTKRLGRISKSIYVMSNASEPRLILKIKGEVVLEMSEAN